MTSLPVVRKTFGYSTLQRGFENTTFVRQKRMIRTKLPEVSREQCVLHNNDERID